MCIVFIYSGYHDPESCYSLVLAANRDEFFDRQAQNMAPWKEDQTIFGGIDLEAECQSTWLAYSFSEKKIGLLLNYPEIKKESPKSRGKIVTDYIKSKYTTDNYVPFIRDNGDDYNGFIFVTVELRNKEPLIQTYTNATHNLQTWKQKCVGFSNSLPDTPLSKVVAGRERMQKNCEEYKAIEDKSKLIESLLDFLKSKERHLPDPILQNRRPMDYKCFSSIFVCLPSARYGTRTHTLMLVTKSGHVDLIEVTMQSPINLSSPNWKRSNFQL
ncbi:transport and Golgi organization protein 2 isoform X1 [Pieris napi]|uniref:transport and Golgi organization protein 2 isoform X1 n=1 Tax=Pieris napi TaxID=78633 RepID=UPI001FB87AA5|nr:transport and Golgi organization protein 2 isoform X1 [Pieris napi]